MSQSLKVLLALLMGAAIGPDGVPAEATEPAVVPELA